jgi:CheY-like chemotaxis protein
LNPLILVLDDEPDVEALFRQQFRRDLRVARFTMDFALSAMQALEIVAEAKASLILILSDVNMPGMSGLDFLPKARQARPDVPVIIHRLWRRGNPPRGSRARRGRTFHQTDRFSGAPD